MTTLWTLTPPCLDIPQVHPGLLSQPALLLSTSLVSQAGYPGIRPTESPHGTQQFFCLLLPNPCLPMSLHAAQACNLGSYLASLLWCASRHHEPLLLSFNIFLTFLFALVSSCRELSVLPAFLCQDFQLAFLFRVYPQLKTTHRFLPFLKLGFHCAPCAPSETPDLGIQSNVPSASWLFQSLKNLSCSVTPFGPHQGLSSPSPVLTSYLLPECPPLASLSEHAPFWRDELQSATCSLNVGPYEPQW